MSLASSPRATLSRTSGSPCATAILTLTLTLAPAPTLTPTLSLTLTLSLHPTLTRYDGEPLPGGKQEASRLEQQTHVAYRDGFYVNGLPLAKAYREVDESVRGRGGTSAPTLALILTRSLIRSLSLILILSLSLTLTLTLTLTLSPTLTLTPTVALTLPTTRCAAAAAVPSPTATPAVARLTLRWDCARTPARHSTGSSSARASGTPSCQPGVRVRVGSSPKG